MITRIISAVVMAVLLTLVILFSPLIAFNGVVLLLVMGGLYEFYRLTLSTDSLYREAAWVYGVAVASSLLFFRPTYLFIAVVLVGLFFVTLIYMYHATTLEGVTSKIGLTLMGAIYLGATLPFWGMIRMLPHGRTLVFMGIAAAAMSDSFAFFAGRAFGRHKFAPLVSPNKTWEGFAAGFAGSIISVFIVKLIGWKDLPILHVVIMGVFIGFIGPMGDLIESLIKRGCHVKDSGSIIPGHGGFLDRLDAMVFVGPFMYLYARLWLV